MLIEGSGERGGEPTGMEFIIRRARTRNDHKILIAHLRPSATTRLLLGHATPVIFSFNFSRSRARSRFFAYTQCWLCEGTHCEVPENLKSLPRASKINRRTNGLGGTKKNKRAGNRKNKPANGQKENAKEEKKRKSDKRFFLFPLHHDVVAQKKRRKNSKSWKSEEDEEFFSTGFFLFRSPSCGSSPISDSNLMQSTRARERFPSCPRHAFDIFSLPKFHHSSWSSRLTSTWNQFCRNPKRAWTGLGDTLTFHNLS